MKAFEQLERMKRINELIKAEKTGTPKEFAKRLGISRRQLYAEIEYFKDLGVEIGYSRRRQTFLICNECEIKIDYDVKVMPQKTLRKINGGFFQYAIPCFFYARNKNILASGLQQINP